MARKRYSVSSKEFGRGKAEVEQFATLAEVQAYVRERWQGPDYLDGQDGFHTDYCSYRFKGFTLADIGKRRWIAEFQYFEFDWLDRN